MKSGEYFNPKAEEALPSYIRLPIGLVSFRKLSQGAKLTWGVLADHNFPGGCFPGHRRLASAVGVTVRQMKRYLDELRAAGFIDTERQKTGGRRPNGFQFPWHEIFGYTTYPSDSEEETYRTDLSELPDINGIGYRTNPVKTNGVVNKLGVPNQSFESGKAVGESAVSNQLFESDTAAAAAAATAVSDLKTIRRALYEQDIVIRKPDHLVAMLRVARDLGCSVGRLAEFIFETNVVPEAKYSTLTLTRVEERLEDWLEASDAALLSAPSPRFDEWFREFLPLFGESEREAAEHTWNEIVSVEDAEYVFRITRLVGEGGPMDHVTASRFLRVQFDLCPWPVNASRSPHRASSEVYALAKDEAQP